MRRRTFLATLAGGAAAALAGCGVGGGSSAADYDIGMGATTYEPPELTVPVGRTVRWRNTNSRAHTVTAYEASLPAGARYFASGGFDTEQAARDGYNNRLDGAMVSGETYEHTFEVPGEYPYFCIPHERGGMVGTVVVEG